MTHSIATTYGTVTTATKHAYIIVGARRTFVEAEMAFAYGEAFTIGYAASEAAARKRVKRESGRGGKAVEAYEVATGQRIV